jgi:hypothetical protein
METRLKVWQKMASQFKPEMLSAVVQKEITLDQLPEVLPTLLKGHARGRIIVKM